MADQCDEGNRADYEDRSREARFGLAIAAYVRQRTKEAPAPLTATAEVYCGWSNSFRNLFFNA
jgi:hypothetical protein